MVTVKHPYNSQVISFVKEVVRHRRQLITRNLSHTNKLKTLRIIEKLTRVYTQNLTDRGAARMMIDYEDDIRYLIPHSDVEKFNTFNQLIQLAQTFSKL